MKTNRKLTNTVMVWTMWKMEGSTEKEVRSVFGELYGSHNDRVKKLTVKHFVRWVSTIILI